MRNYNIGEMAGLYDSWESLDDQDRFFALKGLLLDRQIDAADEAIKLHRGFLENFGFLHHFRLHLHCEKHSSAEDLAEALFTATRTKPAEKDVFHRFFLAENDFLIGYTFLARGDHSLAYHYFQRSIEIYGELGAHALVWRSNMNLAICEFAAQDSKAYLQRMSVLEASYKKLKTSTQKYFSRFFIWLLSNAGQDQKARAVVDSTSDESLMMYQTLFDHRMGKKISPPDISLEKLPKENRFYQSVMKIIELEQTPSRSDSFVRQYKSFAEKHDLVETDLLSEMLLNTLLRLENYQILYRAFRMVKDGQKKRIPILKMCNVDEYGLLALKALNRTRQYIQLEAEFMKTALPWHKSSLRAKLDRLSTKMQPTAELNSDAGTIRFSNAKTFTFRKGGKMLELLETLFEAQGGIEIERLKKKLFPNYSEHSANESLQTLLYRCRRKMDERRLFHQASNKIFLLPGYHKKTVTPTRRSKFNRQNKLIDFLRERKKPQSLNQIANAITSSRRTLQYDLSELVEKGRIKKQGVGRATCYSVPREVHSQISTLKMLGE